MLVTDQSATGHPILDKALFDMTEASKARRLRYWLNTLTYKKLMEEVGHHLVEQGVLVRKKKRLHLVIPYGASPNRNTSAQYDLKMRLREIVLTGQPPEMAESVLLAFLFYGDLLKLVFTHGERKTAHKRVKKLITDDDDKSCLGMTLDEIVTEACQPNH